MILPLVEPHSLKWSHVNVTHK